MTDNLHTELTTQCAVLIMSKRNVSTRAQHSSATLKWSTNSKADYPISINTVDTHYTTVQNINMLLRCLNPWGPV